MNWFNIKQTVLAQPTTARRLPWLRLRSICFIVNGICVVTILEILLIVNAVLYLFVVVSGSRQEKY